MSYTEDRDKQLHEQAKEAFSRHVIRKRSEGRWLLQRPYEDERGGWDSVFWAEIVSLAGGVLYVGGDIRFVLFAHGSGDHEQKVRWMGKHTDFGYYVHQKACIGTGERLINTFDREAADEQLRNWREERIAQLREELSEDCDEELDAGDGSFEQLLATATEEDGLIEAIDEQLRYGLDSPDLMLSALRDADPNFMDDRFDVGMVIDARLHYAYAALRRLCELLDAEAEQAAAS